MARGGVVDEQVLYAALREHRIADAAIDAFAQEPPSALPFVELKNVLFSPHTGAVTEEALEKMGKIAIAQGLLGRRILLSSTKSGCAPSPRFRTCLRTFSYTSMSTTL